jgi:hypothetical protein
MWLANSKRQPCLYPQQSYAQDDTLNLLKKLTNLMGNLCCASFLHSYTAQFNPLKSELNSICHLLALLGNHHILHISRIRVNLDCMRPFTYQLSLYKAKDFMGQHEDNSNNLIINLTHRSLPE